MVSTMTHKILQGLAAETFVPVVFDNTKSGKELYISINRADGYWLTLNAPEGKNVVWQSKFDQTCQVKVAASSNWVFPFMQYSTGVGARMFVSEQPINGIAPNLTMADFVFDKVEMGWNAVWNQTSVDFFGIPVQLNAGSKTVGFKDSATRHSILEKLLNTPKPYSEFGYPVGTTDPSKIYRVFSPLMAMSMTAKPWSYPSVSGLLDAAIESGLPTLTGFSFNYGGYVMTFEGGSATHRTVKLTVTDSSGANPQTVELALIDSAHAFADEIKWAPSTGTGGGAKAAGLIGAAINRGVLYNHKLWGEAKPPNNGSPKDYYVAHPVKQHEPGNAGQFNYYSQCLHEQSINELCYAISYDDFFHQDASITPTPGEWVRITVLPFN